MKEDKKQFSELSVNLNNKNPSSVVDTISELRKRVPFAGAVGLLVSLYNTTDNDNIKGTIRNFMNDLKEKDIREEVINELKKEYKVETIQMITSSCWQSGLDYSMYATVFAGIFAVGDYTVALECYTVLEESLNSLSQDEKDEVIKIIRGGRDNYSKEKSFLMLDLIRILS